MPNFQYKARDQKGRLVDGELEAVDERTAAELLWQKQLMVTSLRLGSKSTAGPRRRERKPAAQDLAAFSRQLATMAKAGVPLVQAIESLGRQSSSKKLRPIVEDVAKGLQQGQSFSESLARHPAAFDPLYVSMVNAGEEGGVLCEILYRLAAYQENAIRLRKKVKSAMTYPVVVALVAIGISLFLILKIIPVFAEIYGEFQSQLPTPTLMLIQVSNAIRHNLLPVLIVAAAVGFGLHRLKRTNKGRFLWDKNKMRFVILGPVAHKIAMSRMTRTFTVLLRSGIPIVRALKTGAKSSGNAFLEAELMQVSRAIEEGSTLVAALREHPTFPPMMLEMATAGEQTGSLDEMLDQVATYYEQEVESVLNGLTSLIEPLLIMFLGVVVGSIVVCMFLPIFKISQIVQF